MTIKVTPEDIKLGVPSSAATCPVARAIRRALSPVPGLVLVTPGGAYIQPHHIDLPLDARLFVIAFDRGESVKPFSFELEVIP